jgi:hypothetical protein
LNADVTCSCTDSDNNKSYKRDHGKQSFVVAGRLANDKSEKKDGVTWRSECFVSAHGKHG